MCRHEDEDSQAPILLPYTTKGALLLEVCAGPEPLLNSLVLRDFFAVNVAESEDHAGEPTSAAGEIPQLSRVQELEVAFRPVGCIAELDQLVQKTSANP